MTNVQMMFECITLVTYGHNPTEAVTNEPVPSVSERLITITVTGPSDASMYHHHVANNLITQLTLIPMNQFPQ
jgi:hypothetical protein